MSSFPTVEESLLSAITSLQHKLVDASDTLRMFAFDADSRNSATRFLDVSSMILPMDSGTQHHLKLALFRKWDDIEAIAKQGGGE